MKKEFQLLSRLRTKDRQPLQLFSSKQQRCPQKTGRHQKKRQNDPDCKKFLLNGNPFLYSFQQRIAKSNQQKGQDKRRKQRKQISEKEPDPNTTDSHSDQLIIPQCFAVATITHIPHPFLLFSKKQSTLVYLKRSRNIVSLLLLIMFHLPIIILHNIFKNLFITGCKFRLLKAASLRPDLKLHPLACSRMQKR